MTNKTCTKCGIDKDISEFAVDSRAKCRYQSACKVCYKLYRDRNIERINIRDAKYRKANREMAREANRRYHANNKDMINGKKKEWRKTDSAKACFRNSVGKRRAILRTGTVTSLEIKELIANATKCYWCDKKVEKGDIHVDHYVPLKLGGLHSLDNLVISCSHCNHSKSAKDPIAFANKLGRLL